MSEKLNIGGEILVELKRKNGKREIFRHNMMTEFGRSLALSNGLNKLKYTVNNQVGTVSGYSLGALGILSTSGYNTINPNPVGAMPAKQNPAISGTEQYCSKLCNLLMNIPSGTLTKKKAVYMPPSENLLAYAFRQTATETKEGTLSVLSDNTAMKNRVVTKYVYPNDLTGQFNCIAMSTYTPYSSAPGRLAKVQRSVCRVNSSSNYLPVQSAYNGTELLLGSSLGKINLDTGEVGEHSISTLFNIPTANASQDFSTLFSFKGFAAEAWMYGTGSNSYAGISVIKADGTVQTIQDRLYGVSMDGIFFKNGDLYEILSGTKYKITIDDTTGVMSRTTTTDDLSDCYRTKFMPLSENDHIYPGSSYAGYFNSFTPSFNNVLLSRANCQFFLHDNKLMGWDATELYSSWNIGYVSTSRDNGERLLTEYGNILSFHQYDNPIVKNVGDELSVTYSYYMS